MRALGYFRKPFPSSEGFSAYRMPGIAVHGPMILGSILLGALLCGQYESTQPLIVIWIIFGIYIGRDVAILCHYIPLLTLIIWAAFICLLIWPKAIREFAQSSALVGMVATALILAFLIFTVYRYGQQEKELAQAEAEAAAAQEPES